MLGEPADRTALSSRISPFNENRNALPFILHPALQTHELDLERTQLLFIEQRFPDFFEVDISLLQEREQALAGVDPCEILFRQRAPGDPDRIRDLLCGALWPPMIPVPL